MQLTIKSIWSTDTWSTSRSKRRKQCIYLKDIFVSLRELKQFKNNFYRAYSFIIFSSWLDWRRSFWVSIVDRTAPSFWLLDMSPKRSGGPLFTMLVLPSWPLIISFAWNIPSLPFSFDMLVDSFTLLLSLESESLSDLFVCS